MTEMELMCAVYGEATMFAVNIARDVKVATLCEKIAGAFNTEQHTLPPRLVKLYLARKNDEWLKDDRHVNDFLRGGISAEYEEMRPSWLLADKELFGENFQPRSREIHVLVVVVRDDVSDAGVTPKAKRSSLDMMLKQCEVVGDLPDIGEILKLFEWTDQDCGKVMNIKGINDIVEFTGPQFYVRKEILCVLENFKKIYQREFDTGELVNKQFILMGSPGSGKSCILALLCFYIAIKVGRPVVWHRRVVGGRGKSCGSATRLFYRGKYYQWKDTDGMRYQYLDDALKNNTVPCWFVVDGLNYKNLKDMKWFARFTLLATSGQLSVRSESMQFMKMCLLPYWKQDDLQNFGLKYMKMKESDVDARYFVSGGSLTEFLDDDAKPIVHAALKCIATPEDAEKLNSVIGLGSNKQIDRIRMQGVPDRNNVENYVDIGKWTSCVTSKLALNKLAQMMKPDFFERLMDAARGMNDDRLEGVAFEGHFHTLVRHRRPICVHYCKYDNVDRGASKNWESIMHQDMGSMDWKELKVDCAGENTKECVVVMKSWAANPSKMEYWIPATSLCETIDAVVKWTAPDNHLRFCFLQLTKATKHKCNAAILWELAQPFVNEGLSVCYIELVPDEDKMRAFRLNPVQITKKEIVDKVPLYVAHFNEIQQ